MVSPRILHLQLKTYFHKNIYFDMHLLKVIIKSDKDLVQFIGLLDGGTKECELAIDCKKGVGLCGWNPEDPVMIKIYKGKTGTRIYSDK